ncbi:hypothetical protein [Virgisporangium aurantiacum]|uniref:hypothetical protein n=1 Tax=Virgisporangium aurantiacum TaxID=175570 RepID=UPI00194FEAEC|nr:hypothetical protein [Virgisporangium aurantiacum]
MTTTSRQVGSPVDGPPEVATDVQESPKGRRIDVRHVGAWLAVAWLLPVVTHLLSVDWLLPPLVLVTTASLLRGGRTLLDRLMLASALLIGTLCAAGLLFTAWPFGFQPIPIAGTGLTVLGAISVLTGRRPRLPRPALTDGITVVAALGVAAYVAIPYIRTDSTGRLAMLVAGGEDVSRHVSIFDTLRRIGGFAYWQTPQDVPDLFELLRYYPSGWHLSAGVLDSFVRSSSGTGDMVSSMDHFVWFFLAAYGFLALAIIWAAQWIAGPLLGPWRLPLIAFLGTELIYSDIPVMVIFGFPSEIFGLALLALLAAVIVRRPSRPREQMVLIGALLVGIGFSYELFLPSAALAAGGWLLYRRRLVRPHLVFALVVGVVAGGLAIVPITLGTLYGRHGALISAPGPVSAASRAMLLTLGLVLAAALLMLVRRLRVWRSYVLFMGAVLALPIALRAYVAATGGKSPYYFEKALHSVLIVALVGLGAVALVVGRHTARLRGRQLIAASVPAVLVSAAIAVGAGVVLDDMPSRPGTAEKHARLWHSGAPKTTAGPWAKTLMDLNRKYPPTPGATTIVLSDNFYVTYTSSLFFSMLQRTSGTTDKVMYYGAGLFSDETQNIADSLARPGVPIRLIVLSPKSDPVVDEIRRLKPDLQLEVLRP